MRVVVTSSKRLLMDPEGNVWTGSTFDRAFCQRYLSVFDEVRIVARVKKVAQIPAGWKRVDGNGVTVFPLPYYVGARGCIRVFPQLLKAGSRAFAPGDAVILRQGSPGWCVEFYLILRRYPYALEVTGDPGITFTTDCVQSQAVRLVRWWSCIFLKYQIASALAVSYVTERYLQEIYPPKEGTFVTHYSSVDLPDEAFASCPRQWNKNSGTFKLVAVGSMAQRYKGYDVLIQAVRECVKAGYDIKLTFVGDGRHRPELESLAKQLQLNDRVRFTGELPGPEAVRQVLVNSDLFIHPSKAEGLPRALIEAMAQGLPCIGSTVGGIPELLSPEDMVEPRDFQALAGKIQEVLMSPERMNKMSERNLKKAREFHRSVLQKSRIQFYSHIRKCTEDFLHKQHQKGKPV